MAAWASSRRPARRSICAMPASRRSTRAPTASRRSTSSRASCRSDEGRAVGAYLAELRPALAAVAASQCGARRRRRRGSASPCRTCEAATGYMRARRCCPARGRARRRDALSAALRRRRPAASPWRGRPPPRRPQATRTRPTGSGSTRRVSSPARSPPPSGGLAGSVMQGGRGSRRAVPGSVLKTRPAMSLARKTLFITGASRGIGLAIALKAAADGANIVIAAKTDAPHPKLEGTIHTAAARDRGGRRQGAAARRRRARRGERRGRPRQRRRGVRRHRHRRQQRLGDLDDAGRRDRHEALRPDAPDQCARHLPGLEARAALSGEGRDTRMS